MTRLVLCILILGGTVGFLSCGDSLDGNTGAGGKGGGGGYFTGTDGTTGIAGRGGTGGYCGTGCDGTGPLGGTTGSDGTGPAGGRGGTTGVAGRGGGGGTIGPCDGIGTGCGGRGGESFDGSGPSAGRGGTTGGGGRGGAGGTAGAGGTLGPCDGLGYFEQSSWCASAYGVQAAKQITGNCDYVRVFTGTCDGKSVWTTRYSSLGDPIVCAYDSAGHLVGARICTDTTMGQWNCNGAPTSPMCLSAGSVPNIEACALTTTCDATGGRGGGGPGWDGVGPIGGRGGG